VTTQPMLEVFEPVTSVCARCGQKVWPHYGNRHVDDQVPGFAMTCRSMATCLAPVNVWLESLALGYRCRGGEIVRDEGSNYFPLTIFLDRARAEWGDRVDELDAWVVARARWLGVLDILTGDELPRWGRTTWTPWQSKGRAA